MIGLLSFNKKCKLIDWQDIENQFKKPEFKTVIANAQPTDICQLPNGFLVLCNSNSFALYDQNFKLVNKINEVKGKKISARFLTTNHVDSIYFTDTLSHQVVMCDLSFNHKKSIGSKGFEKNQFNEPNGIFFHKKYERLYICDSYNKRIQVYTSSLDYLKSYALAETIPLEIKIVNNTACIRSFSTYQKQLQFYNLTPFTVKFMYTDHGYPISVIYNNFYQLDPENELLKCYNSNGILIEQIATNGVRKYVQSDYDGILAQFNKDIILSSCKQERVMKI